MADLLTASALRRDLAEIVAATFMGTLAIIALLLYVVRRRSADATSLTFSAFALLYAIRLVANTTTVPRVVGGSDMAWEYGRAALTYAIVVPSVWFAETLLGPGWRGVLRWLRRGGLLFAPLAIGGMFVTRDPEWIMRANNAIILMFIVATALMIRTPYRQASRFVQVGLMLALLFVIAENLRALGVLPWPGGLEFIGMMIFLSSLGFAVADRFLQKESRLAAVDRELATARRIQQSILPERVPAMERFAIAVRYVPMTEVAGDFYDFLDVGGPRGTLLVADVAGHGVPAALIASMVKIAAASHADKVTDPGELLSGVSQTLQGQLGGQFLTAMCLHLDAARGEIAWSGAGHPPILHWHAAESRLDALASDGILIGMMAPRYASRRAAVGSGDRLILYTDGVLEATNTAGEFFGDHRFQAIIAHHAHRSGGDIADAILDEMKRWSAHLAGFEDDVTLIVVEVR